MEKESSVTEKMVSQMLDWAYEKSVEGFVGVDSAEALAMDYLDDNSTMVEQANSLIRWQNAKAGTSGFVTGLGGLITLPIAIPANIGTVIFMQVRMVAAIAHMGGFDLRSDQVKTMVYVCLLGQAGAEIFKQVGVELGKQFTKSAIKSISGKTLTEINKQVGFRLFTKFGEKGVINLGKAIPLLAGVIGATVDVVATNTIGNTARKAFIESALEKA